MQRSLVADLAGSLALFFAWLLALQLLPYLPPLAATGEVVLFGLIFASRFLLAGTDPAQIERRARSRVRALGPQWPWAIITALAITVLLLAFLSVYTRLVPPPELPDDLIARYLDQRLGWLPIFIAAVAVRPVVEEVIFRGWVQGRLSEDFGPEFAIVTAAGLYAIVQLDFWGVPYRFLLGLASGYTVYLTRSIWAGVLMNAAFNGALYLVDAIMPDTAEFSALSEGALGMARVAAVILAAGAVASFAWHRQKVIRDRNAEQRAANAGSAPPD
jgi:membrane protease YdiL (CAAX protease family)